MSESHGEQAGAGRRFRRDKGSRRVAGAAVKRNEVLSLRGCHLHPSLAVQPLPPLPPVCLFILVLSSSSFFISRSTQSVLNGRKKAQPPTQCPGLPLGRLAFVRYCLSSARRLSSCSPLFFWEALQMTHFYQPPQFSNQLPTRVLCDLISTPNHFAIKTKEENKKHCRSRQASDPGLSESGA